MPETTQGYCVKCKAKKIMKDVKKTTIEGKGGKRNVAKGSCPTCDTKMVRFLKANE